MGTATYFSPEQAQGQAIDQRSDVYALGVVLYEMVTGRPPFQGDNPVAIAYQHVQETPIPPAQLNPDVPPELQAVILRALAKRPDDRYPTANDLRADLLRFREGKAVAATTMVAPAVGGDTTQVHHAADRTAVAPAAAAGTTGAATIAPAPAAVAARRNGAYIVLLLVLLAILGVLLFLLYQQFSDTTSGSRVTVPNVRTKPYDVAAQELRDAGLEPLRQDVANDQVEPGIVFEQTPSDGEEVAEGSEVTLQVSAGAPKVAVPNVVGQSFDDASEALRTAGFQVAEQQRPDDEADPGTVLEQNPAAGTEADKGATVTLVTSSGPEAVRVPDVSGLDATEAAAELGQAGFRVASRREASDRVDEGLVIRTDPEPGSTAEEGSTVTIFVSTGPEETTTTRPTTTTTDPDESPPTTSESALLRP
jgi:serine/threonine-protein kinase